MGGGGAFGGSQIKLGNIPFPFFSHSGKVVLELEDTIVLEGEARTPQAPRRGSVHVHSL